MSLNKNVALIGALLSAGVLTKSDISHFRYGNSEVQQKQNSTEVPVVAFANCTVPLEEGPWKAVNEVFRLGHDQPVAEIARRSDAQTCQAKKGQVQWNCIPSKVKSAFLIASVADPNRTHLALFTDRGLESLMWGIEDSGYNFENYWLPWSGISQKQGLSIAEQQCQAALRNSREVEPGLLLFRRGHNVSDQQFLYVFVVGETPTSGLNRSALSKAIKYVRQISKQHATPIGILGPTFSGSLRPLKADLVACLRRDKQLAFHLVSGTASNREAINDFKAGLPQGWSYESAVDDDVFTSRLFFRYLDSQWRVPWLSRLSRSREIAVLSEDETVYGSGDLRSTPNDLAHPRDLSHDWLMLRYPREIGRLRNAYPEETIINDQPKSNPPVVNGVPLTLRDAPVGSESDPRSDSIATFAEQQSPASQQAVLLAISAVLRRERAAYAGVLATDVLDSLFLTRFLHLADPDIRIFTLDSDLLFLRQSETVPMVGLLAVTNYPLFSRNQHWTEIEVGGQMPRRIQFSSRFSEGIYNACRRLVSPITTERSDTTPAERFLEYKGPFDRRTDRPPVWLTVLGRDGYWPIALLDDIDSGGREGRTLSPFGPADSGGSDLVKTGFSIDPAKSRNDSEPLHPEPPSRSWILVLLFACSFCLLHSAYVIYLLTRPKEKTLGRSPKLPVRALGRIFDAYPDGRPPSPGEKPFLLTATISLFSSLLVFSLPLCQFLAFKWALYSFRLACACLGLLLLVAFALMFGRLEYSRIVVLTWLMAVLFPAIWAFLVLRTEYRAGIFLAYRALYLGTGVSPGIPIVLLATAFYGWAWIHLKRESAAAKRRRARENKDFDYLPQFRPLIERTDDAIEKIMASGISLPALAFVSIWFVFLWPIDSLRTLESYQYDLVYISVITILYWCIGLVWVQFIRCWRTFRELLQALERHPIRAAFSHLPKEISWIPLASRSPPRNLFLSSRTCECLAALVTTLEELEPWRDPPFFELEAYAFKAKDLLKKLEDNVKWGEDIDSLNYEGLQLAFNGAAQCVVNHLESSRWSKGTSESLAHAENEVQPLRRELTPTDRFEVLCEEFIAYRILLFLRLVIRQLRNWLGFVIGGFMISIISLNSYPFQGHRWIGVSSVTMLVVLGSGVAFVFAEMDKDAILSRLTDTNANQLGKTFFLRLASFGALPILTVAASQFPSVSRYLFSWVQPALDALK